MISDYDNHNLMVRFDHTWVRGSNGELLNLVYDQDSKFLDMVSTNTVDLRDKPCPILWERLPLGYCQSGAGAVFCYLNPSKNYKQGIYLRNVSAFLVGRVVYKASNLSKKALFDMFNETFFGIDKAKEFCERNETRSGVISNRFALQKIGGSYFLLRKQKKIGLIKGNTIHFFKSEYCRYASLISGGYNVETFDFWRT